MLKAIHKIDMQLISAYKLENDSTWIGTEDNEWIAPKPEVSNWKLLKMKGITEVKVSFIKSQWRQYESKEEKTFVRPHFRIITEHALPSQEGESEEHKLAKQAIYDEILNNNIFIEDIPIKNYGIDDIDFEYHLSKSSKSKIADVIVIFKEEHSRFGKGIVFEVQFSSQNREMTEERTYDRVLEGYSVVWLWEGDFDEEKLVNNHVLVTPFSKAIKEYQELIKSEWEEKSRHLGILFEKKIQDEIKRFDEHSERIINQLNADNESYQLAEKELKRMQELKISSASAEFINRMENFIQTKLNEENFIQRIGSLIDYKKISSSIQNDYQKFMNTNIQKVMAEEISKIKPQIAEIITNQITDKVIPNIEKQYLHELENNCSISSKCHGCNASFPVRTMDFQSGWSYCPVCFNNLKTNWKKEMKNGETKNQDPLY